MISMLRAKVMLSGQCYVISIHYKSRNRALDVCLSPCLVYDVMFGGYVLLTLLRVI